jgi:hypothetical protein
LILSSGSFQSGAEKSRKNEDQLGEFCEPGRAPEGALFYGSSAVVVNRLFPQPEGTLYYADPL